MAYIEVGMDGSFGAVEFGYGINFVETIMSVSLDAMVDVVVVAPAKPSAFHGLPDPDVLDARWEVIQEVRAIKDKFNDLGQIVQAFNDQIALRLRDAADKAAVAGIDLNKILIDE